MKGLNPAVELTNPMKLVGGFVKITCKFLTNWFC